MVALRSSGQFVLGFDRSIELVEQLFGVDDRFGPGFGFSFRDAAAETVDAGSRVGR